MASERLIPNSHGVLYKLHALARWRCDLWSAERGMSAIADWLETLGEDGCLREQLRVGKASEASEERVTGQH